MATIKVLRVAAKREGFRRAGLVFGSLARDVPVDALTDAQRAAIIGDPMLLATEIEVEVLVEDPAEDSGGRVPHFVEAAPVDDPDTGTAPSSRRKRK